MTNPTSATQPRPATTRTARHARKRLSRALMGFEDDTGIWWKVQRQVPEAWATLEDDIDCEEAKVKVTLRIDASVAKFFRAMGKGYQERINRLLVTYAQMRIGEVERERQALGVLMERYGIDLPERVAEAYRRIRPHLAEDGAEDLAWWDQVFGVGE